MEARFYIIVRASPTMRGRFVQYLYFGFWGSFKGDGRRSFGLWQNSTFLTLFVNRLDLQNEFRGFRPFLINFAFQSFYDKS